MLNNSYIKWIAILMGLFCVVLAITVVTPRTPPQSPQTAPHTTDATSVSKSTIAPITEISSTTTSASLALHSDAEWRQALSPQQYSVLRQAGTERPGTSPLLDEHRAGTFVTADCGEPVFRSEAKFDSGTGWPSFYKPIPGALIERTDTMLGYPRTEILSAICHSHLGHLFHDAPQTPSGDRYCINGVALVFVPDKK